jgi:hypothetical protein
MADGVHSSLLGRTCPAIALATADGKPGGYGGVPRGFFRDAHVEARGASLAALVVNDITSFHRNQMEIEAKRNGLEVWFNSVFNT